MLFHHHFQHLYQPSWLVTIISIWYCYCIFGFYCWQYCYITGYPLLKTQQLQFFCFWFCGSGIQEQLSWAVISQGLSGSCNQVIPGLQSSESSAGLDIQDASLKWLASGTCCQPGSARAGNQSTYTCLLSVTVSGYSKSPT